MLLTWRAYVANLDPKKTDELIFSVMKKYYDGDILEKMFAEAKKRSATTRSMASNLEEEMWRSQGKMADNLFKFLKLDEKGDDLFESPVLGTWVSYINRLNTYEKRPDEFVVINELEKRFDYVDPARMLGNTEHQAGMRGDNVEIVASLRKLQFKQWMTEKRLDPKRVGKLVIQSPDDPRNNRVILDFYDFYKANGRSLFY
ncbi:hypothetical protein PC114_g18167 [Phytophthora cactorum]|nr:hypothetical protein PC114_g18167 [Phytophthora cactorum]